MLLGAPASTAEVLMRSRYTAFAIGDPDYVRSSWHPRTRPDAVDLQSDLRWVGLSVIRATEGGEHDDVGTVEFRADFEEHGSTGGLHEVSRFVRWRDRWVYLDGMVSSDEGTPPQTPAF